MKYCPFCGASLVEGAAFCTACGKTIPVDAAMPVAERPERPAKKRRSPAKQNSRKPKKPKPPNDIEASPSPLPDDGYDGYYDDVLPLDDGGYRERLDRELLKRALLVGVGAAVIVVLCIVLMQML